MDNFTLQWTQLGTAVAAIGALGTAAFGIVESFGKVVAIAWTSGKSRKHYYFGLPYTGLGVVKHSMRSLLPALKCAYGEDYFDIIAEQYRAGRIDGAAPDTIRQGIRLGLPFLGVVDASAAIASVWHMDRAYAHALAHALQAPSPGATTAATATTDNTQAQALAGRFAAALDARITAAFQLADERYETVAKTAAGFVAVGLALLFNWGLAPASATPPPFLLDGVYSWWLALLIGLLAVPIAPVAKDLSSNLQNALTAFKSISGKP